MVAEAAAFPWMANDGELGGLGQRSQGHRVAPAKEAPLACGPFWLDIW